MLVGDIITSVRSQGPDPSQTVNPPLIASLTSVNVAGGNFSPGTQVWVQTTVVNQWGETSGSTEATAILGGGSNAFAVVFDLPGGLGAIGPTFVRVYFTTVNSGLESVYEQYPIAASVNLLNSSAQVPGAPPSSNRAWLPDTDGGFASAVTMYQWLNESLKVCARATGGIQDTCGIASVSGMRRYVVPGQWLKFTQCFYDGWELDLGNKANTFRNRNLTANIAISLMVDAQSDTTRIELYWTPSRTSGTTITTAPLLSTDSNVAIAPATGWLLADGLVQVGSEILTYSAITGTQLQNVIRGWNGTTVPLSLASEAPVIELNIEITGYRMPATYSVGQSTATLGVPPGWEPFLKQYMLGLFREAEQERQEASDLMKQATTGLEQWAKSNKPVAGPRQCQMYGNTGIRGLVPGGLSGGIIIP